MVPVAGELIEDDSLRFVYSADCLEDLEVYNSPNCDEEHLTGLRLHPGAIVRACALWITTAAAVSSTVTPGEEGATDDGLDGSEELQFVKMADNKGWVPVFHPITGGEILTLISQRPKPPPAPAVKAEKVEKVEKVSASTKSSKNSSAAASNNNSDVANDAPRGPSAVSAKTSKPPPPATTIASSTPSESVSEKPKTKAISKSTEKTAEKSAEKSSEKSSDKVDKSSSSDKVTSSSAGGTSVKEKIAAKNKTAAASATPPSPAPAPPSASKYGDSIKTTPGKLSASIAKFETGVKSNASTSSSTKDAPAGGNALEAPRRRVVKPAKDA